MVTVWVLLMMSITQGEGGLPSFISAFDSQDKCQVALVREATRNAALPHGRGAFYQCATWQQLR